MRAAIAIALAVTAAFCLNRFAEDSWWASDGRLHYEADEASPIANRSTTSVADASSVDDKAGPQQRPDPDVSPHATPSSRTAHIHDTLSQLPCRKVVRCK
jgi:hypothetical protein